MQNRLCVVLFFYYRKLLKIRLLAAREKHVNKPLLRDVFVHLFLNLRAIYVTPGFGSGSSHKCGSVSGFNRYRKYWYYGTIAPRSDLVPLLLLPPGEPVQSPDLLLQGLNVRLVLRVAGPHFPHGRPVAAAAAAAVIGVRRRFPLQQARL